MLVVSVCGWIGCADVDIPEAPSMTRVIESLKAPSATLDPEDVEAAIDRVAESRGVVVDQLDGLHDAVDIVQSGVAQEPIESIDTDEQARNARNIVGFALAGEVGGTIRVICRGWDGSDRPDGLKNGRAVLNFTATESGIERVVWGSFERCKFRTRRRDVPIELDGDIKIYLAGANGFYVGRDFVFALDGTVSSPELGEVDLDLAFRITQSGKLYVRVAWHGDYLIYSASGDATQQEIRDRNETWRCDLEAKTCEVSGSGRPDSQ